MTTVTTNCSYCGMFHHYLCPRIKSIQFNSDGTQKSVEFFAPKDYPPIQLGEVKSASMMFRNGENNA